MKYNIWHKFHKLTLLEYVWKNKYSSIVRCSCECWIIKNYSLSQLSRKKWFTSSCWCYKLSKVTTDYTTIWENKKNWHFLQCWYNLNNRCKWKYKNRGIIVEWKNYSLFKKDMFDSYLNHCKKYWKNNTTIERINNNKNYSIKNCKWITKDKQAINKSNTNFLTIDWITKPLVIWCKDMWVNVKTYRSRVYQLWWTPKKALLLIK